MELRLIYIQLYADQSSKDYANEVYIDYLYEAINNIANEAISQLSKNTRRCLHEDLIIESHITAIEILEGFRNIDCVFCYPFDRARYIVEKIKKRLGKLVAENDRYVLINDITPHYE